VINQWLIYIGFTITVKLLLRLFDMHVENFHPSTSVSTEKFSTSRSKTLKYD